MMYYSRIHSREINPLVKEALLLNKDMPENGIFTWYTFAKEIFSEFHLDKSEYENYDRPFKLIKTSFKKVFKKAVCEQYDKMFAYITCR